MPPVLFECRNNTHSRPQPSTVLLRQRVFGSFQSVTPALITPGNAQYTPLAPLTVLPSLYQQCFSSPSCSLLRVTPYPTLGVLTHLQFLNCRLQWVPATDSSRASRNLALLNIPDVSTCRIQWVLNPYIWSSTSVPRCPALLNIPDVLTCCRLEWIQTWALQLKFHPCIPGVDLYPQTSLRF